jgi:hypothetical protein
VIGTHKRDLFLKSLLHKDYSRCVAAGDSLATFSPTLMIQRPEPPQKRRRALLTGCGILAKWRQKHIRT